MSGDVIRSNFIRSTSVFDLRFYVEIEDRALGQQILTWVLGQHWGSSFRSTNFDLGLYVDTATPGRARGKG